jgi:hypothetical protein
MRLRWTKQSFPQKLCPRVRFFGTIHKASPFEQNRLHSWNVNVHVFLFKMQYTLFLLISVSRTYRVKDVFVIVQTIALSQVFAMNEVIFKSRRNDMSCVMCHMSCASVQHGTLSAPQTYVNSAVHHNATYVGRCSCGTFGTYITVYAIALLIPKDNTTCNHSMSFITAGLTL